MATRAVRPVPNRAVEARAHLRDGRRKLSAHDNVRRRNHAHRVRQRVADKLRIDERHDGAGARHAKPRGEIVRAICHHEDDDIARGNALRECPARVAIAALR